MFGSKEKCPICGAKLPSAFNVQLSNGKICANCGKVCTNSPLSSVEAVQAVWKENHRRFQQFHQSKVVTNLACGFMFIDLDHKWVYLSTIKKQKNEPVIFSFSEIEEYTIERIGEKTITKTKGGITRAVVGGALAGPVGAIVGASTASTETKTTGGTPFLKVKLNLNGLKTQIDLPNPPFEAETYLASLMDQ